MQSLRSKLLLAGFLCATVSCGTSEFGGGGGTNGGGRTATPTPSVQPTPGGLDQSPKNPASTDPTNDVEFGGDKVFRIGDNAYSGSSCQEQLDAYDLSGTTYLFDFTVLENDTQVSINVTKICGVDYNEQNIAGLQKDDNFVVSQKIKTSDTNISLTALKLNPGTYSVVVQSVEKQTGVFSKDFDDFIVGKIHIKSDKKITPGVIRTK